MKRFRIVATLALLGAALLPSAAWAQYGTETEPLTVSDTTVSPGDSVVVSGSGFAPGSEVEITIESAPRLLATVRAGAQGKISATVRIPTNLSGSPHTLKATGVTPDGATLVLSMRITVLGTGGELAFTGTRTLFPLVVVGALLLLAWVSLRVARRRARV